MSRERSPKRRAGLRRRGHPGNPATAAQLGQEPPEPPAQPLKSRHRLIGWTVAIILAVATIAIAFSQANRTPQAAKEPVPRSSDGSVIAKTKGPLSDAKAGDCLSRLPNSREDVIGDVTYVPCTASHQALVLGWTDLTETGTEELAQAATKECIDLAIAVTGADPNSRSAGYQLVIVPPENGLTAYLCLADYSAG